MAKKADIKTVTIEELAEIVTPAATKTHVPIPYHTMVTKVMDVARDIIEPYGYTMYGSRFQVRDDGSQMFGTLTWSNGLSTDMGFMIGIRNSNDKSIAAGLCVGAHVFVCSNMMFTGDIVVMRKNTTNSLSDFEKSVVLSLYDSRVCYQRTVERMNRYKGITLDDPDIDMAFGHAFRHGLLAPQQMTVALNEWKNPTHPELAGNTVFSLYQAMNTPLKKSSPRDVLEAHKNLDTYFQNNW